MSIPQRKSPLELMRHGVSYKFPVRLREFEITFRPLTELETTQISDQAQDTLLKMKKEHQTDIKYSAIFANKTIELASTSAPGRSDFQISELELTHCTPDEVMFLFDEYNKCVDRVNPSLEKMSKEALNELIEQAKKNASITTMLSFWQLENLCRAFIEMNVQADNSSGGSSTPSPTDS